MAVAPELPDVTMTKQTVIPRVHGVYKHNKTLDRTYPNGVADKNRTESGQNSVPVVHFVEISEKMEISVHTAQALELFKTK